MGILKILVMATRLKKVKCEKHRYYKGYKVDKRICQKCSPCTVKRDHRSESCGNYEVA